MLCKKEIKMEKIPDIPNSISGIFVLINYSKIVDASDLRLSKA